MYSIIFNIIESEIDHIAQHRLFDGWNAEGKLEDDAYLEYEKCGAQPAIDWCNKRGMKFEVTEAEYAMRITFNFERAADAVLFKTRWL